MYYDKNNKTIKELLKINMYYDKKIKTIKLYKK